MSQTRTVERRAQSVAMRSRSGPRLSTLDCRLSRTGLTLVELLITITIIAILASMILGVASVAGETARESHTRHMVTRLHTLLMQQLDTYKTRRVKLRERVGSTPGVEDVINIQFPVTAPSAASKRGAALAEARLYAKREMLLLEIPDRWSDVLLTSIGSDNNPPNSINSALAPLYLSQRTELSNVYLRRYLGLIGRTNEVTGEPNTAEDLRENQGAECLYMVITIACGDGEARTLFHESNIGDTDGDGAPEFLDGWGHPIGFLRWAPGFYSDVQLSLGPAGRLQELISSKGTQEATNAVLADHDPNDLFRSEAGAFRLVPLIYSWGGDEMSGLNTEEVFVTWRGFTSPMTANQSVPFVRPQLTPYAFTSPPTPPQFYLGSKRTDDGELATDNIHNHLLGERNR